MTAALTEPEPRASIEPPEFWESLPVLQKIRQHARARRVSPWATLGVVLARALTAVSAEVVLPPSVGGLASLNLLVAIVGRAGQGKGGATSAGSELLQPTYIAPGTQRLRFAETNLGSGEGLAAAFAKPVKGEDGSVSCELHTDAVLFHAAEIDTLLALLSRTGATLSAELRKVYSGEPLGFNNRATERSIIVPAHTYRAAVLVGVQPERSGALLDDTAGGLAQRFLWMDAQDPEAPEVAPEPVEPIIDWIPETPAASDKHPGKRVMGLCYEARSMIEQAALARLRGEGDALDGHALLTRLKVAAALNLLNGSMPIISEDDWRLAGLVMEHSDTTRQKCVTALQGAARAANRARALARGEAEIETDVRAADVAIAKAKERILLHLGDKPLGAGSVRKRLSPKLRDYFDAALDELAGEQIVTVSEVVHQGQAGLRIALNTSRGDDSVTPDSPYVEPISGVMKTSPLDTNGPADRACVMCGTSLEGRRPQAKTCSNTCAKRLSRSRQKGASK